MLAKKAASKECGCSSAETEATRADLRTHLSRRPAFGSPDMEGMARDDSFHGSGPCRCDSPRSSCQTGAELLDSSDDVHAASAVSACCRGEGPLSSCHAQIGHPRCSDAYAEGEATHEPLINFLPIGQYAQGPTPLSRHVGHASACARGRQDDPHQVVPISSLVAPQPPAGPSASVKKSLSELQMNNIAGQVPPRRAQPSLHEAQSSIGGCIQENSFLTDTDDTGPIAGPLVGVNGRSDGLSRDPSEGTPSKADVCTRLRDEVARTVAASAGQDRAVGHDLVLPKANCKPPTPQVEPLGQALPVGQDSSLEQGKEAEKSEETLRKPGERVVCRRGSPSGRVRKKSSTGDSEPAATNTASGKRACMEPSGGAETRQKFSSETGHELRVARSTNADQEVAAGGGLEVASDEPPPETAATEVGAQQRGPEWDARQGAAGQHTFSWSTWTARGAARLRALRTCRSSNVPAHLPSSLQPGDPVPAAAASASGSLETSVLDGNLKEMRFPSAYDDGGVTVQLAPQQVGIHGLPTVVVQVMTAVPMVSHRGPHGMVPHYGASSAPRVPQVLRTPRSRDDTQISSNPEETQWCRNVLPAPSQEQVGFENRNALEPCDCRDIADVPEPRMRPATVREQGTQRSCNQQADQSGVSEGQALRRDGAPVSGTAASVGQYGGVPPHSDTNYGPQADKRLKVEPADQPESHAALELEVWKRSEQVPIFLQSAGFLLRNVCFRGADEAPVMVGHKNVLGTPDRVSHVPPCIHPATAAHTCA